MHLFCVALFVMVFPGLSRPDVETYATVLQGACPAPEMQQDLALSLKETTGAAHVQFLFNGLVVQTEPGTDI